MVRVKIMSRVLIVSLFLICALPFQSALAAEVNMVQANYLALGDSLAAGINPEGEKAEGYADMLAYKMTLMDGINSFNNGFSSPGYTTADVLSDIEENVEKDIYGFGEFDGDTAFIQDAISDADIITLSIGANDALGVVQIDNESGNVEVDIQELLTTLQQAQENLKNTVEAIQSLNEDVEIYVMGYYNPFPHLPDGVQSKLDQLLGQLNNSIQQAIKGKGVHYVETKDTIAMDAETYLPNPENIHLSEEGYEKVAALFWTEMESYPWIKEHVFTDVKEKWAQLYVEQAASSGLVHGYGDGIFKPNDTLTRVQAASIFTRMLDLDADEAAPFSDTKKLEDKTKAELNAAYEAGLIQGYGDDTFRPYGKVTRAQLALMIKRSLEYQVGQEVDYDVSHPFTDVTTDDEETQQAITLLYNLDIANGSNGEFMPDKSTTRQQAAKMLVNAYYQISLF